MTTIVYDGSFEGLLTSFFEIYEYKLPQPKIYSTATAAPQLFGSNHTVTTDAIKAERVLQKLGQKISPQGVSAFFISFLSENKEIENILFRYLQYALTSKTSVENDYSHPDVLFIQQTVRKVHREKHRMKAFVRFKKTKDDLYYCLIQPDFNVLPLIATHFKERYKDQRWLIYDIRRKYGMYYDLKTMEEVEMNFTSHPTNGLDTIHDEQEELYQQLWQQYFSSVNIAARKNMKLHLQHIPKRYWKFLTEKVPVASLRY